MKTEIVYVIGNVSHLKIGITSIMRNRLSQIQTGNPLKVKVLAHRELPTREASKLLEKELHDRYAEFRAEGEWFEIPYNKLLGDLLQEGFMPNNKLPLLNINGLVFTSGVADWSEMWR